PELLARLQDGVSPDQARILQGGIFANDTVPLDALNQLTVRAAELTDEPVFAFARRAGRFGAGVAIRSVYKFILSLLSASSVVRAIPRLWGNVYNTGRVTVEVGDGQARVRVEDFPSSTAQCGRFTGWLEFVGESTSVAREVRVEHTSCQTRGD